MDAGPVRIGRQSGQYRSLAFHGQRPEADAQRLQYYWREEIHRGEADRNVWRL